MNRNVRSLTVAFVLALALLAQGSCGSGKAKNSTADSSSRYSAGDGHATNVNSSSQTSGGVEDRRDDPKMVRDGESDVPKGSWGGEHVRLEVSDSGAEIEFDCAHGSMGKISPDRDGGFDVSGLFVRERGGPARIGSEPKGQPARYHGKVAGETMTLYVTLTDSKTDAGTFTLTRGKAAQLKKCL